MLKNIDGVHSSLVRCRVGCVALVVVWFGFGLVLFLGWFDVVWFGLVWFGFGFGLVWFGLVWFGFGLVLCGLVWFGLIWSGLV